MLSGEAGEAVYLDIERVDILISQFFWTAAVNCYLHLLLLVECVQSFLVLIIFVQEVVCFFLNLNVIAFHKRYSFSYQAYPILCRGAFEVTNGDLGCSIVLNKLIKSNVNRIEYEAVRAKLSTMPTAVLTEVFGSYNSPAE